MLKSFFAFFAVVLVLNINSSAQDTLVGLKIGQRAPELILPGVNDQPIALSSLRGKVVLIQFWASWHGPSRWLNPKRVLAYTEFRDKIFKNGQGFEIYSVSLDNQKWKWKDAIEKDNLYWSNHVSDLKWWKSAAVRTYKLEESEIPCNYLIDKNGIILAKDLDIEKKGTLKLKEELNKYLKP